LGLENNSTELAAGHLAIAASNWNLWRFAYQPATSAPCVVDGCPGNAARQNAQLRLLQQDDPRRGLQMQMQMQMQFQYPGTASRPGRSL